MTSPIRRRERGAAREEARNVDGYVNTDDRRSAPRSSLMGEVLLQGNGKSSHVTWAP